MNPRISIYDNWDGTQSVYLDGEAVLERKSHEECRVKASFLDTYLAVKNIENIVDNPPPAT